MSAGRPVGGARTIDPVPLSPGASLLPGFAEPFAAALLSAVAEIATAAPFRSVSTPGGRPMSVTMTNCGAVGWITDRHGYRYSGLDPQNGKSWPAMPEAFASLAAASAAAGGFQGFIPDACLINRYQPGARMTLHRDHDERDFTAPIVSVSLGLPAMFLWGGAARTDRPRRVPLDHGDVVVWGGDARLRYHGILPVKPGHHPAVGAQRINLTFRRAC